MGISPKHSNPSDGDKIMKIDTKWNLGNFAVALGVDVTEEYALGTLAPLGLRFLGQRNAEVDKVLGGYETGSDGKQKRKAKWKRSEVGFTSGFATSLASSFGTLNIPGSEEKLKALCEVVEYVRETSALKYRDAKEVVGRHESAGDLEEWLTAKIGYEGDTHGVDGEYEEAMLLAVHKFIAALRASV